MLWEWEGNWESFYDFFDAGKKKIVNRYRGCLRGFLTDFWGSSGLRNNKCFYMDNSKYHDLYLSPCILILTINLFSHKKVYMIVKVNIKVYKQISFIRNHVTHVYIFILHIYICIQIYVYMYKYMYTCKRMDIMYI